MALIDIGIAVTAVNNATAAIRDVRNEITGLGENAQATANRLKAIQVVIAGIVINKIRELGKSFLETSAGVEVMQTRLSLLTGDWKEAGRVLDQLTEKYDRLGVDGDRLAEVFVRLRGIGQSDEQAKQLVDTIAKINAATDRTPEKITSLGDALTKMLAKGTVDMRVLITVLGNQFPEALKAAATAAGAKSVVEFTELAKAGQISGQKFAQYLIDGINTKFGSIFELTSGQLNTGLNRVLNIWRDSIRKLNLDTPLGQELNVRLNAIADAAERMISTITVQNVKNFFETLDNISKATLSVLSALRPLVPLVAELAKVVANLLADLPPEVLLAGIIGVVFFGSTGRAIVITIGVVLNQLGVSIKDGFINDIIRYMSSSEALGLGVFGLIMFGPLGAAALTIIGAKLAQLRAEAEKTYNLKNSEPFAVAKIPNQATQGTAEFSTAINNVANAMKAVNAGGPSVFDLIKQKAKDAGLTVEQTAAIIAHAKAESGLGANVVGDNGHSFGIFQFNDKGELKALQDFADKGGKSWLDYGVQVDFVIQKFKALGGASAATAEEASKVMNRFERFGDFLKNGDLGTESLNRMKSAAAILKQISETAQVPTTTGNDKMSMEVRAQFDGMKVAAAGVNKQIDEINASLNELPTTQAVTKVNAQFAQLAATLKQNIDNLEKLRGTVTKGSDAEKEITAQLTQQQAKYEAIIGVQTQKVLLERQVAENMMSQVQLQQRLLQLKAQEASIALKTQNSNNPLFNILGGTSGGQVAIQVQQQRLQLTQQIAQYELQVQQLEQEKIKSTDPELRASIAQTQSMYRQLASDTRLALSNLTAESVAARQMWNSVGAAIEGGAVNAISGLITHTMTLKQATVQMYNAITQAAVKYLIQLLEIKAIMPLLNGMGIGSGFGGFFGGMFANGGVFPGGIKMFANGGIIGGPTLFGMAGEAGTEAVMPLTTVNGKLGVRASGGGGGDQFTFQLHAIDTQTGIEFLLKNLDHIAAGLSQRKSLNRGRRLGTA